MRTDRRFRGIRYLIHYVHHVRHGFGWMFLPSLPRTLAWFPSDRHERPCAYDHMDRPISFGNRWRVVNTEHGVELHDCTKSGVF